MRQTMQLNDSHRSLVNNTLNEKLSQVFESQHLNVPHICLVKKRLNLKEVSGTHQTHMGGEAARGGGADDAMWVGEKSPHRVERCGERE